MGYGIYIAGGRTNTRKSLSEKIKSFPEVVYWYPPAMVDISNTPGIF